MKKLLILILIGFASLTLAQSSGQTGFDWPQWRGPNRDGISAEKGLLKTWPPAGPRTLWRVPIGEGYSGIAVSNGRLYTMEARGGDQFVLCLDAASGKEIWRFRTGENFSNDMGSGPRATPTIDGNWLYTVDALGRLYALNARDGKVIWKHDLKSEFGSEIPQWGTATSPLIEKDLVLLNVGGSRDHGVMAFNKKDGSVVWKTHTDKQGYSSPVAITVNGVRQILFFTGTSLVGVSTTGQLLWKYPWRTDWYANIATPIFIPPDKVFISTSYGVGAALLKIKADKGSATIEEVYKSKATQNHFNTSVYHQDHIYGFDNAILQCIEANTGTEKWKKSGFGKGSLLFADGHLIVLGERGQLALVEATPQEYREKANAQVLDGKTWTMPTLANGKLYLRHQKELVCLDVKAAQ